MSEAPRGRKQSQYGIQLREKQKAKQLYGLRERQFKNLFDKASKKGQAGANLMKMLEMRFDNLVYRLGWAITRPQARQMVSHCQFTINDKQVNIPSYQVKSGDIVKIRTNKRNKKSFTDLEERMKKATLPSWLNYDAMHNFGKVLHEPALTDCEQGVNTQAIVEFYSR